MGGTGRTGFLAFWRGFASADGGFITSGLALPWGTLPSPVAAAPGELGMVGGTGRTSFLTFLGGFAFSALPSPAAAAAAAAPGELGAVDGARGRTGFWGSRGGFASADGGFTSVGAAFALGVVPLPAVFLVAG